MMKLNEAIAASVESWKKWIMICTNRNIKLDYIKDTYFNIEGCKGKCIILLEFKNDKGAI